MKSILCFSVFIALISIGACSSVVGQTNKHTISQEAMKPPPLSMNIAKAISYVYVDYPQLQKTKSCLEMTYREDRGHIFVSIYSKAEPRPANPEEIVVSSGQGNNCGPHFSYKFDKSGSYMSKTGIR